MADKVGRKGWQKRLAKGTFAPSSFAIPEAPVLKSGFVNPWLKACFRHARFEDAPTRCPPMLKEAPDMLAFF